MSQRNVGSPMADAVFDLWRFGQSAYIPSVAQLRLLKETRGRINQGLRTGSGKGVALFAVAGCDAGDTQNSKPQSPSHHNHIRLIAYGNGRKQGTSRFL